MTTEWDTSDEDVGNYILLRPNATGFAVERVEYDSSLTHAYTGNAQK